MSSMRNAVQRRPHRERAQPLERTKHGLLEKHKDYSKRAADFNAKKARLRILRQKATDRNPDEFNFGMMSSRTNKGVKVADRGNAALGNAVVKLMKTQDAGYLKTMATRTRQQIERLEGKIQLVEKKGEDDETAIRLNVLTDNAEGRVSKHTVFFDDNDLNRQNFDPTTWLQTDTAGLTRAYNRPRLTSLQDGLLTTKPQNDMVRKRQGQVAKLEAWKEKRAIQKKRENQQEKQRATIKALREREVDLLTAERTLESQRDRMQNNVGGVNKNGVKFKVRERKR